MKIQFVKSDKDAVTPYKAYPTDIGFNLTAIKLLKVLDNGVHMYDTGIVVCPPEGYHTEICARSSIIKSGWMLANNTGYVEQTYRGNLLLAMVKIDKNSPDLSLPFCLCQLVLRKTEFADMEEVESLNSTERGTGGFGSTNK